MVRAMKLERSEVLGLYSYTTTQGHFSHSYHFVWHNVQVVLQYHKYAYNSARALLVGLFSGAPKNL